MARGSRLISDRIRNKEKTLEMDRAHFDFEIAGQCHKTSLEVESTGKKERGDDGGTLCTEI